MSSKKSNTGVIVGSTGAAVIAVGGIITYCKISNKCSLNTLQNVFRGNDGLSQEEIARRGGFLSSFDSELSLPLLRASADTEGGRDSVYNQFMGLPERGQEFTSFSQDSNASTGRLLSQNTQNSLDAVDRLTITNGDELNYGKLLELEDQISQASKLNREKFNLQEFPKTKDLYEKVQRISPDTEVQTKTLTDFFTQLRAQKTFVNTQQDLFEALEEFLATSLQAAEV